MDDKDFRKLKSEIRQAYIKERSKGTTSTFILTKKSDNDKIWEAAAKTAAFFFLPAEEYVGVIAEYYRKKHLPFMQHYLVGSKAEQIIREYKERIDQNRIPEDHVKEYVDWAFKFASLVIRAQNDVEYSILSPSNDFDPWLRLYLAENLPNKDKIYRDYEEAAKQQLIENPALARELKNRQIEIKFRNK